MNALLHALFKAGAVQYFRNIFKVISYETEMLKTQFLPETFVTITTQCLGCSPTEELPVRLQVAEAFLNNLREIALKYQNITVSFYFICF